jgi:two-component system phosphate regulon sensor histidine kinase PhoR
MSDGPRIGATGLATRFVIYYALTYLVLIGLMGFIFERTARDALIEDVRENLEVGARLASESLPEDSGEYPSWAEAMFEAGAFRFTLIDKEGVVLADSHSDPKVMENHADRPEVEAALAGDVGSARRVSASTGFDQLYVALPPESGLIVRASVPTRIIDAELSALRGSIIFAVLTVGLVGVFVVALVARRTVRPVAELTEQSRQVAGGRLDVSPPRSRVSELDQLGLAISSMADTLGSRIEEAEQATATLETVLAAIPQGTILIDRYDKVIYASQAALELLGSMPVDLGGLSPLQLQIAVREARATESTDTRFFDHGNPARRIRAVATPFSDERVLLVVVDVTDRERTDSIRRDFVANASHELKTPVSTIIASSEAMQIALSRGDQSAMTFASRIEESARQLNRLVGDLLDLSRLEREELERGPVRLDLVARDEVERVRVRAEEKDLSLDLDETELTVDGSHRDLAIALRNLLDNALRYTTEGGTVTVSVLSDEEDAVVRVTDSGEGIPTRDRERVFERFYRVDSARSRETGGTGLGLSIVKHVAESHGGSVELESELGVGSTFIIRLPLGGGNREDG